MAVYSNNNSDSNNEQTKQQQLINDDDNNNNNINTDNDYHTALSTSATTRHNQNSILLRIQNQQQQEEVLSLSSSSSSSSFSSSSSSSSSSCTTKSLLNSTIAGYVAGITGIIIGYPFDSAKVWHQTNSIGQNKYLMKNTKNKKQQLQQQQQQQTTSNTNPSSSSKLKSNNTKINNTDNSRFGSIVQNYLKRLTTTSTTKKTTILTNNQLTINKIPKGINSNVITILLKSSKNTIRALYSGASGPFITSGIFQSLHFMIYDSSRRILYSINTNNHTNIDSTDSKNDYLYNDSLISVGIAALLGGSILSIITSPLAMIKTKQQITGNNLYAEIRLLLLNIKSSLKSNNNNNQNYPRQPIILNVGFGPHILCNSIGRIIYHVTYEYNKRYLSQYKQQQQYDNDDEKMIIQQQQLKLYERMICASISGIVCWSVIFPIDSIRSRMYSQLILIEKQKQTIPKALTPKIKTTFEMIQYMLYENNNNTNNTTNTTKKVLSLRSFYRGYIFCIIRAGPVAAAVLPIYDSVLLQLS